MLRFVGIAYLLVTVLSLSTDDTVPTDLPDLLSLIDGGLVLTLAENGVYATPIGLIR